MKNIKRCLIIASALFLSACSLSGTNTNPFASSTTVTSVYTSQFPDVPVPMDMKVDAKSTLTTISSNGEKVGREYFSGRIEHNSLGAAMAHNLKSQAWTMIGIVQGKHTLQLYQKGSRFLIVTIDDTALGSNMEFWMINRLNPTNGGMVQEMFSVPATDFDSNTSTSSSSISVTPITPTPSNPPAYNAPVPPVQSNEAKRAVPAPVKQETNATPPAPVTTPTADNTGNASNTDNFDSFGSDSLFK